MKILKFIPFILYGINTNSSIIMNNKSILIHYNQIQSRSNTIGFRGDTISNKRAIVWSGEKVEFQYTSETQQGSNQFCIWNEWYFKYENNLNTKYDNKQYNEYINWECLNFWGNDSKNGNSHNIKNKLVIESVNQNNEGFYNLQYNYKSGGTLGIQNHIFSAYPFQLIVIPNDISASIVADKLRLYYGEKLSLSIKFNNNIYKYIDANLLSVTYQWKVKINNQWINLANNENEINNLILEPGNYKFLAEINFHITDENNIYKPIDLNIKTKDVDINVLDNININIENSTLIDNFINLKSIVYYKNSITIDQNLIDWAWYKYNYEGSKYEFYSTNNQISINLYQQSKFIFKASTLDQKETKWSNEFIINEPIITNDLNILINDFDYCSSYDYIVYDENNEIYEHNEKNNELLNISFKSSGIYKVCINENNGNQVWQLIEINNQNNEQLPETPEVPNEPNDEIIEEEVKNNSPIYKQPWFYIIIAASSILLIILIIWLIKYLKNKKN